MYLRVSRDLFLQQITRDDQELQELRAKICILEVNRADDSQRVRGLETPRGEVETLVSLLSKRRTHYKPTSIATRGKQADFRVSTAYPIS